MRLENNLAEMERSRERYWLRYPSTSPFKLRWRANAVRRCFHVLPGETILAVGAPSGAVDRASDVDAARRESDCRRGVQR